MEQKIIDKLDAAILATKNKPGVALGNLRPAFLERRILFRMRTLRISDYSEYVQLLTTSFDESKLLQSELSINVTKFFRDPYVWDFLQQSVIPGLLTESRVIGISAWSCACASGEEAHSISILLNESLLNSGINYNVFATDISSDAIEHSKNGIYTKDNLVNVSDQRLLKFFEKTPEGKFLVNSQIRNKIKYSQHNMTLLTGHHFDIIFCRNVLIYYSKDIHATLFKTFSKQLKKNGILVLGQDESMIGTDGNELFELLDPKNRVYRKKQNTD